MVKNTNDIFCLKIKYYGFSRIICDAIIYYIHLTNIFLKFYIF